MAIAKGFTSVAFLRCRSLLVGWAGGRDGRTLPLRLSLFIDQIVFSASNFLLTISIVHAYSYSALAGYGIALSLALSIQSAQRGVYIVPFALLSTRVARKVVAGRVAEHFIVLAILFPFLLLAALLLSKLTLENAPYTILASVLCGLLYFGLEFERMALIKCGHIWTPLICSGFYLAAVGLIAVSAPRINFGTAITILSVFCIVKSTVVLLFLAQPNWSWGYRMLRRDMKIYAPWSVMGALYYSGYNQVPFLILAAMREPAQAAAFVAIRSLTQPLQIVIRSLDIVDKHSLRDESAGTADGIRAAFWRTFISYACIGVFAIVVMAVFRQPILRLAYGTKFQGFSLLLPLWGLFSVILAITLPVESLVNISRKFNSNTVWRLLSALLGVSLALILCPLWGAYGAALATVLGALFALMGSIYALRDMIFKSSVSVNEKRAPQRTNGAFHSQQAPRKQALLICAALPQLANAGNLSYLYAFLDYLDSRKFETTVLIVGYRLPKLLFRLSNYIPFSNVRLAGGGLVRFGDWILVMKVGAWRRAIYGKVMDSRLSVLTEFANRVRQRYVSEAQVIMGHFVDGAELAAGQRWIARSRADVVLVDTIFLSAFRRCLPTGARSAIIAHDVFHQRYTSFANRNIKVAPLVTAAIERDALKDFDNIIAISGEDASVLASLAPDAKVVTFASPIAPVAKTATATAPGSGSILFIGSKSSHNVDGLLWFLDDVWPGVRQRHPSATLDIVGSVCEQISGKYAGVNKHNIVKDIAQVARRTAFAVNPVKSGSGLKIKMLDYLAHGLPFVASPIGVQGLPRNGSEPFLVSNDAASFCEAVNLLLGDPEILRSLAQRCAPYATQFSRSSLFDKLDAAFV